MFFLIQTIAYKKNLCQTEEEITDELVNNKMIQLINALINNVILLKS